MWLTTSSMQEKHPAEPSNLFQSHQEQLVTGSPRFRADLVVTPPPGQPLNLVPEEIPSSHLDPLSCAGFFASPIQTLVDSVEDIHGEHLSLHDIADAYATFSMRIQDNANELSRTEPVLVALELLKSQALIVATALRRDIRRALADPMPGQPPETSMSDDWLLPSQQALDEQQVKCARDQALVCHQSLQFLSNVFRFSVLQQQFSVEQIGELLDDAISIALAPSLPMLSSQKSRVFCLWMLQTQRLPLHTLTSRNGKLVPSLIHIINAEIEVESTLESVKVVHHLVKTHPSVYMSELCEHIPSLLLHLISLKSSTLRHELARLLGLMVQVFLASSILPSLRLLISSHIISFIEAQTSRRKLSKQRLLPLIDEALDRPNQENKPQWAITLVANLVVLSDALIFSHPLCLKFILPIIAKVSTSKSRTIRDALSPLWKCVIWAFARLRDIGEQEPGDSPSESQLGRTCESAFLFCNQGLVADTGAALVGVLLGRSNMEYQASHLSGDVDKVIQVIAGLVKDARENERQMGLALLSRLLSGIGFSHINIQHKPEWDYNHLLPTEFFDGSILDASRSGLQNMIAGVNPTEFSTIRQLSEAEIASHWDPLLRIWVGCVNWDITNVPSDHIHIWQSLLLTQTQLTQERGHFTSLPEFAHKAAFVIIELLQIHPENPVYALILALRLWTVMKNVFAAAWLSVTADSILAGVLDVKFDHEDSGIETAWDALCVDLVSLRFGPIVSMISNSREGESDGGVQRFLWGAMARNWEVFEAKASWEVMVEFLLVPFRWSRSLDHNEIEIWDRALRSTIQTSAVRWSDVVERMLEQARAHKLEVVQVVPILLSNMDLDGIETFPKSVLVFLDDWLRENYPPMKQGHLAVLQALLGVIGCLPLHFVVPFISSLDTGISLWILDEAEALTEQDYNTLIMPIYEQALRKLEQIPPDIDTLHRLANFLSSAFGRIPPPALGPLAFKRFWDSTYQSAIPTHRSYPDSIECCLRAYHEVYGGDPPTGVTMGSSQSIEPKGSQPDLEPSRILPPEFIYNPESAPHDETTAPSPNPQDNLMPEEKRPHFDKSEHSELSKQKNTANHDKHTRHHRSFMRTTITGSRSPSPPTSPTDRSRPLHEATHDERSAKRRKLSESVDLSTSTSPRFGEATHTAHPSTSRPHHQSNSYEGDQDVAQNTSSSSSNDDCENWEIGITSPDIRHIRNDLSSEFEVPDTEMSDPSSEGADLDDMAIRAGDSRTAEPEGLVLCSPSTGNTLQRRSYSVPVDPGLYDVPILRRSRTTLSVEVLQEAFDALQTDASQLPVADLVHAASLARELDGVLQEKLRRKLHRNSQTDILDE